MSECDLRKASGPEEPRIENPPQAWAACLDLFALALVGFSCRMHHQEAGGGEAALFSYSWRNFAYSGAFLLAVLLDAQTQIVALQTTKLQL